jgi:ribosomal protein S27E
MGLVQQLITTLAPRGWAADMEAESRAWMIRCSACNFEQSVWDWGGIRWGAAGNPKRYLRCPQCGQSNWHTVYRKA